MEGGNAEGQITTAGGIGNKRRENVQEKERKER